MKFGTVAATALLAVGTVGVSTATVHAEPTTEVAEDIQAEGTEHGVGYRTTVLEEGDHGDQAESDDPKAAPQAARTIATTVTGGQFALTEDNGAVTLTAEDGETIAEVPLAFDVNGGQAAVAHEISDDGQRLALTPEITADQIGEMRPIDSMSKLVTELEENVVGIVAGGLVGGLVGALLGLGFFSLLTGPIGIVVGAVAGGMIMGGKPFSDSVFAVLNGEP